MASCPLYRKHVEKHAFPSQPLKCKPKLTPGGVPETEKPIVPNLVYLHQN